LAKANLTDRAYQEIKEWIVRYHLKPGARLHFGDLVSALNMSHTPIREALSKLENERLVERLPGRGYAVRAMDLQEVEDLYDLRIALEVLAVQQATKRMGEGDRKRLTDNLAQVTLLLQNGQKDKYLALEQDFHVIIMVASGNRLLAGFGKAILDRIWMIQNINVLTSDHLAHAHEHHESVFTALQNRDPRKAATLMRRHLEFAKGFVLSRLRRSDDVLSKFMTGLPVSNVDTVYEREIRSTTARSRTRKHHRETPPEP
jgi:DNA-binding GntR family transcriptional regulator